MRAVYAVFIFFAFNNAILASITFSVTKVKKCTNQHSEMEGLNQDDLARWTVDDQIVPLENFHTNYPLAEDLNGKNY